MKNKLKKLFIIASVLPVILFSFVPTVAFANNGPAFVIRPDCNQEINPDGTFAEPCRFEHILELIRNIIRFIVLYLTAPAMALGLAYSGFLIMTSGTSADGRSKAKDIMKKIIFGFLWAISAWLIVELIYSSLGYSGFLQFN